MVGFREHGNWEEGRDSSELQKQLDEMTQRARRPVARRNARVFPSIIISATDVRLVIRAEVPGMELDDFDISVSGDLLTVEGTRKTGLGLEGGWYHRRERESGSYRRAIRLPAEVDAGGSEASYTAGVLTISLPLKEEAKPKQIPIRVVEG